MHNLRISSFLKSIRDSYIFFRKVSNVNISIFQKESSETNRESAKLYEQSGEFWIVISEDCRQFIPFYIAGIFLYPLKTSELVF